MKILCICQGGNVRSVTTAYILKNHGHDAIAASYQFNSEETLIVLMEWADKIIIMEEIAKGYLPKISPWFDNIVERKTININIGPDVWGIPLTQNLQELIERKLKEVNII